jgi:hypothetical protein
LVLHAVHWWPSQAPPLGLPTQSKALQQSPTSQVLLQHLLPVPQSPSWVQAAQVRLVQSSPCGQSAEMQQSPVEHRPPQHTSPAPHCAESVQGVQLFW